MSARTASTAPRRAGLALLLAAALAAAGARPAAAQGWRGEVEGTVRDAGSGRGITHATVVAAGRSTTTDSAGRFRLTDVPVGSQRIDVRAVGYRPAWVYVTLVIGETARADVTLEAAAVSLPEVVVSTSREEESAALTPLSVAVIGEDDIREARAHHPSEVVNRSPGVYVSNFGGEGHATAVRQPISTKALYAYLEDGVPIRSTGFFNHNALYEINLPQAGRIEVIKGPGSAVYGSDAIGGVFNAFTRDPSERPEAEIFMEGGSATYLRALGSASSTVGRHGFRADVNVTRSDGWRQQAPYDRQSGSLRWDVRLSDRSRLKTVATLSHVDQPADGGHDLKRADFENAPTRNYFPIAFRRVFAARLSTELQVRGEQSSFGATLYTRYNDLDLLPAWQLTFDPQVWESRHKSIGLLTRYRHTIPALRTNLSAGLDLEYSPGSRLETGIEPVRAGDVFTAFTWGETQYDYDVTFWQTSPYVQADVVLAGGLRLDAGLRLDHIGYDYENRLATLTTGRHRRPASTDVSFSRLSPKVGVAYQIAPTLSVFGSYRAAFRAPSESQLFRQGSAESTVDLEPVKAHSWEAGVRTALGGVATLEATVYTMRLDDDILTFLDPDNGLRLTQNAGETRHRGIEVGLGVAPLRELRVDLAASYAKHTYEAWRPRTDLDYSGNEMELAPRFLGNARVTYRPDFLRSGSVSVEWVRLGSYWMDAQNTHKYDGHDLFNAFATVPVTGQFELVGRVTNIGDRRYAETSSFDPQQGERFRPGAPRQFYLGAQYRFGG